MSIRGFTNEKVEELMTEIRSQYEKESLKLYDPAKFKQALFAKDENITELLKYAKNGALELGFENERIKFSHPLQSFLVDIYIPDLQLAIDFDKFEHFYGTTNQRTGFNQLKTRVLRESGIQLEVVRFNEIKTEMNDLGLSVIPAVGRLIQENLK